MSTEQDRAIEELRAKQQNTLWPDAIGNSRSVDEFLWRGAPDAPLVQRIGAWLFGLAFTIVGISLSILTYEKHAVVPGIYSIVCFYVGGRIFLNGFNGRKNAKAEFQTVNGSSRGWNFCRGQRFGSGFVFIEAAQSPRHHSRHAITGHERVSG